MSNIPVPEEKKKKINPASECKKYLLNADTNENKYIQLID